MEQIQIHNAMHALGKPSEKEEIVIEVARQYNVRFNMLKKLYELVSDALDEGRRWGFVNYSKGKYSVFYVDIDTDCNSGQDKGQGAVLAAQMSVLKLWLIHNVANMSGGNLHSQDQIFDYDDDSQHGAEEANFYA